MTLTILCGFLFLALISFLLRRRRIAFAFVVLHVCGLIILGTGFLPTILLRGLQRHPRLESADWQKRSAIVLLGNGGIRWGESVTSTALGFSRVFEAARLYHDCTERGGSCVVVPTGADPLGLGITEAELMKRALVGVGVPEVSIIPEPQAGNTFQNALFTRELVVGKYEQIVLVTAGYHMARALKFFQHFGMEAIAAPSDQLAAIPSVLPKGMNFALVDLAMHEYLGILRYHVYNMMGWNAKT